MFLLLAISNDTLFAWVSVYAASDKTDYIVNLPINFSNICTVVSGVVSPNTNVDGNTCSHSLSARSSVVLTTYTTSTVTIRRAGAATQKVLLIGAY